MSGGFVLDAGALIAVDRGDRRMLALLEQAREAALAISVTAPAMAQAWRNGKRQARLAAFLGNPSVQKEPFAPVEARAAGELAAMSRHSDVVDVHVVLLARRRGHVVVTSDPDDLRRVDPRVELVVV